MSATESAERGDVVGEAAESDVALVLDALNRWWRKHIADRSVAADAMAIEVLAALADRLLPPVVQTREEWRAYWGDPNNDPSYGPTESEEYATSAAAGLRRQGWPDVRLERRTISTFADDGSPYGGATLTGKWRNVDE